MILIVKMCSVVFCVLIWLYFCMHALDKIHICRLLHDTAESQTWMTFHHSIDMVVINVQYIYAHTAYIFLIHSIYSFCDCMRVVHIHGSRTQHEYIVQRGTFISYCEPENKCSIWHLEQFCDVFNSSLRIQNGFEWKKIMVPLRSNQYQFFFITTEFILKKTINFP